MKYTLISLILVLFCVSGFSQELDYALYGAHGKPIQKVQLIEANSMVDINEDYPSSWIAEDDYVSSEIRATSAGETISAKGVNDIFTSEQKSILKKAEMGTNIDVEVKYNTKNSITKEVVVNTMNFTVSLVPENNAEFTGGQEKMDFYLKKNAVDKINESGHNKFEMAKIRFVVDKNGKTSEAQIIQSSEDEEIDQILLESIANMPKWTPAESADGVKVKQAFEFVVGMMIGC